MDTKKSKKGFTLIELMVTVVLVAILGMLAGPPFQELIRRNQIRSITDHFVTVFNTGRSEAIKTNRQVTICTSNDGLNCNVATWDQGWVMFVDTNANGAVDGVERVVQTGGATPTGYTLRAAAPYTNSLVLNPDGSVNGITGRFRICSPAADANLSRSIVFTTVGRPRLEEGTPACP